MIAYRIGSGRYPANDGLGASLYGGRWNHKGTPVIYTAASRALCALEILANADELAGEYLFTPIEVPNDLSATTLSIESHPPNWDASEPTHDTVEIGTECAKRVTSA